MNLSGKNFYAERTVCAKTQSGCVWGSKKTDVAGMEYQRRVVGSHRRSREPDCVGIVKGSHNEAENN